MRRLSRVFIATSLTVLYAVFPLLAAAQQQTTAAIRAPHYDPATEVVAEGVIEAIKQQTNPGSLRGIFLTLITRPLSLDVHLGLLGRESVPFQVGDQVEVTGSLVKIGGAQILLAREVRSADKVLTVRNAHGLVRRVAVPKSDLEVQQP